MKNFILAFALLLGIAVNAQQIPNGSYTDCNNNTQDIHSVLASGKVLVIALKGLDCSICKSHATDFQNFVSTNSQNVVGWGAMIYAYSSQTPSCSDLNNWKSTYSWNDIFMFIDANKDFLQSGVPRYIVVNPIDSMVVYDGSSINTAKQTALQYVTALSVNEEVLSTVDVYQSRDELVLNFKANLASDSQVGLYNLLGQEQVTWPSIKPGENEFRFSLDNSIKPGVYLVKINSGDAVSVRKVALKF